MTDALDLAALGAVLGEPARARMLTALMSGIALTATELALEAEVAPSTASAHLARLADARLVALEKQGRHRYYRLAAEEVGEMLEELAGMAARRTRRPPGPADPALRAARVCYDHLAGEAGVRLLQTLKQHGVLSGRESLEVTARGEDVLARFGIDVPALADRRRPLCRTCLDWSERRHHLGGALGAAILERMLAQRWARREPGSRVLELSAACERKLVTAFS